MTDPVMDATSETVTDADVPVDAEAGAEPVGTQDLVERLKPIREEIVANLVMLAQIPAPTGEEAERVRYVLDRFVEAGLPEAGPDEAGNAVGMIPGRVGERTIAVVGHLDTIVPRSVDHNVLVQADRCVGPGISDNALGAAVVTILPTVLAELGITFDSNLQIIGSVGSLGRANHSGLRFLLDHLPRPIDFGVCVEGVQLGRLNYFSIGTLRGDIACDVSPAETSRSYGSENAIVVLNHIVNRFLQIEVPQRPFTSIRLAKVHGGASYDVEPDHAEMGFEVNSHSDTMIGRIQSEIEDFVSELNARHAVDASVDFFMHRRAGGLRFSHPLVKAVVEVMKQLDITADQGHSPSELSEFINRGIPAVTLGMSEGQKNRKKPDYVLIDPILVGVAQLIGVLQSIDRGECDDERPEEPRSK